MSPRFDEVRRLADLEKKATPAKWYKAEEDEGDCDEINGTIQGWETGVMVYDRELGVFHPTKEKWRVSESEYEEVDNPLTVCSPEQESDANLIANLRNAAPWLLEAAACFQPGDAERIARIAKDDLLEGCCSQCDADVDMMHRLQKAAKIMEGQE